MPDSRLLDGFSRLTEVMARLRRDCPWDRRQTHASLRQYLLEECFEVLEALDSDDAPALREELGDLLFQIWFHCELASESDRFDLADVVEGVTEKLVRRHPHVFGDDAEAKDAAWVRENWQKMKMAEGRNSLLQGVPLSMPSLQVAHALQAKAATVGFDWPDREPVLAKVREELGEFLDEVGKAPQESDEAPAALRAEFGDLLFALVNVGRWLNISPEDALRETNLKFRRRFRHIEDVAAQNGRDLDSMTLEEMDALWDEAKRSEQS